MQIYVHIEQMRNGQFKNNIITVYCIVFYILSNGEHSHKSSQLQIFFKSRSFLQGKLKENCHFWVRNRKANAWFTRLSCWNSDKRMLIWQKWSLNWPNMRKSSDVSFVGILRHDKEEQSERVFASLWFSSSPLFFFSVVSSRAFITSRKVFSFRKWRGMVSIEQNYGNNTGQSQKKKHR